MEQAAEALLWWYRRPEMPKLLCSIVFIAAGTHTMSVVTKHWGVPFLLKSPVFGHKVLLGGLVLVEQLHSESMDLVWQVFNLGPVFARGSTFGLHGAEHRTYLGGRMQTCPEETLWESVTWTTDDELATLPAMMMRTGLYGRLRKDDLDDSHEVWKRAERR
ncbi:cytochrome P450 [Mycobacteroides abscessus subsp. abscessus]|nr:cytochrome P450 [Mycobacteroides abscessus subsp. abscessus]